MQTKPESVIMTFDQLDAYSRMIVTRTIEAMNLTRIYITHAEISTLYGRTFAKRARASPSIKWIVKGSDKAGCYCLKSEFERFVNTDTIECYTK